jgi:uncharacterized protein YgbK (DUF1537 family)
VKNDPPIACVLADDLSGACECAGLAGTYGLKARVHLGARADGPSLPGEVHVYDLDCRTRSDEAAARVTRERLDAVGTPVYLKIDSAFRGPIGAMLRVAAESPGFDRVLVCCAVPYTERWTIDGVQTVRGVPLDRTSFARHRSGPVESSHLPTLLAAQIGEPVVSLRPGQVAGEWPDGARWAIADAQSEADLCAVARVWRKRPLSVGAGGLWQAILEETGQRRAEPRERLSWRRPLVVDGSRNPVAKEQIRRLRGARPEIACVIAPADKISSREAMRRIVEETLTILTDNDYDGLVLSGGETSRAVLDSLGVETLEVVGQIAGVLTEARIVLPGDRCLNVVVKPGSYGGADLYEAIFA